MAIVTAVIDRAQMDPADATALGFATFASAIATSAILLPGNSLLHAVIIGFAGVQASWLGWVGYMAVPGLLASGLTWGLQLLVFPPSCGRTGHWYGGQRNRHGSVDRHGPAPHRAARQSVCIRPVDWRGHEGHPHVPRQCAAGDGDRGPPMVAYASAAGWSGLVPALLVYTAVQIHYLLPFQHVTILLWAG
jgi:hypothetical protein